MAFRNMRKGKTYIRAFPNVAPPKAKTKLTSGMTKAEKVTNESKATVKRFCFWGVDLSFNKSMTPSRNPTKAKGYEKTNDTATAIRDKLMSVSWVE